MPGRRYRDGLHQALEAKEGVQVEGETQTLATITLQNYFRMYEKLAGMTGTAETEAAEFCEIYKLDVVGRSRPTSRSRRIDYDDVIYKTQAREVQRDHRGDRSACTSRACRCWSARSRSRSARLLSPHAQARAASSTTC